jgi:carboxymethylenebutenolidase
MTTLVDLSTSTVPGISTGLKGYLARPEGDGPWPGVVAVFEAFGADEVMLRQCERLARAGYLVLMPDLFSDGGFRRCVVSTMRALSAGHGRPFDDIEAARQWLLDSPDCTGRVGVIGFCMGGGFALLTASRGFDAASVNYGAMPPKDLDAALTGACPLVGSYGGRDRQLRGVAGRIDVVLTEKGVPHDLKEYPNAGHSFLNDAPVGPRLMRPLFSVMGLGPEPASAADAWDRIERFFGQHLSPAEPAP